GIHPSAVVAADAQIAAGAVIGPLSVVGPRTRIGAGTAILAHVTVGADVVLGRDCLLHPGARAGGGVVIGVRVILHHSARLGADGLSYVAPEAGSVESAQARGRVEASNVALRRINSVGTVVIEDDVEIGANSAV